VVFVVNTIPPHPEGGDMLTGRCEKCEKPLDGKFVSMMKGKERKREVCLACKKLLLKEGWEEV